MTTVTWYCYTNTICCWFCRLGYVKTFMESGLEIIGIDTRWICTHMPWCMLPGRVMLSRILLDRIWIISILDMFSWPCMSATVRHVCWSESIFIVNWSDTDLTWSIICQSRCCTILVVQTVPRHPHDIANPQTTNYQINQRYVHHMPSNQSTLCVEDIWKWGPWWDCRRGAQRPSMARHNQKCIRNHV